MAADGKADAARDRRFMAAALAVGRWNQGRTWPNPAVGAILVQHGAGGSVVVGRGATAEGGRPHAEVMALRDAGDAARGATCYVTLEPCSHHGKTGPCSTALLAAGVARVVSAVEDPDPRVAGRGHEILKEAGVAVTTGVLAAEARRVHAGHFRRVTEGRPHVLLKLAVAADGAIGRRGERAVTVTGALSRALVHALRAENDAILVGIGTALADDPELTCRLPGLERRSPVRVVLDGAARLPLASRLVATAGRVPLWVAVSPTASPRRVAALEASGAVILVAELGADGRLDAGDVLHQLAMRGITRVMAEGGAELAESLAAADLVDEAMLFLAPAALGGDGVPVFGGRAAGAFLGNPAFEPAGGRPVGDDRLVHFWRREKV